VEKTGKDNQKNQPYKDFIKFLKLFCAVLVGEAAKFNILCNSAQENPLFLQNLHIPLMVLC